MTQVERASVGGVQVFFADGPPSFGGSLLVRVGRSDETAATGGISHLVEHLALPVTGRRALHWNGSVDNILSSFWATGDADLVLPFLAETAERLGALPLERLETERNILLAEEALQGPNPTRLAFALRFGPREHGLVGYDEYGLRALEAEDVAAWARTRFVTGNAAIWLTGTPEELRADLPPGGRRAAAEPRELDDLALPAFYPEGPFGMVAFSLLARRSSAFAAAVNILEHRVQERIRYELGLSYSPAAEFMPLTDELVHTVVAIDTMAANSDRVIEETLTVLETLAADGPTEEELDDERRFADRSLTDPTEIPGHLFYAAAQHLLGAELVQPAELVRQRKELGREEIAAALAEALETLLVIAPPATARPYRLAEYPLTTAAPINGRVFPSRGFGVRRSRLPQLVVGDEGVTIRTADASRITARFDECVVALRYPDTSRTLLTSDGFFVGVDPAMWRNGRDAVRAIDAALPPDLTIRMEPALTERVDAVHELADASLNGRRFVGEEVELLPERLEEGESPVALLSTTKGLRTGLLVATDRRLIFFARVLGEVWLEWDYGSIKDVRVRRGLLGSVLRVLPAREEEITFSGHKRREAEAFVETVRQRLR